MSCKDSIVLIHAHLSDYKRLQVCSELIKKIKGFGYEVIVTTHTPAPKEFQDSVDYFVYDKDNLILTDLKYLGYMVWYTPNFDISSKEFNTNNTVLAVQRLMHLGVEYAKLLRKKYIHIMDYDGLLHKSDVLNQNDEKLKNGLDGIFYYWEDEKFIEYKERGEGVHVGTRLQITTRLISAKVDYLSTCFYEAGDFNQSADVVSENGFLIGEEYYAYIFNLTSLKDYKHTNVELINFPDNLETIGMEQDRMHTHQDFPWVACIPKTETVNQHHLFLMNPHCDMNFKVFVNDILYYDKTHFKYNYHLLTVPEEILRIHTDDNFFREYDLTDESVRARLMICNSLYFKEQSE